MWVGAHFGQVHSLLPNTQLPQLNGDVNYSRGGVNFIIPANSCWLTDRCTYNRDNGNNKINACALQFAFFCLIFSAKSTTPSRFTDDSNGAPGPCDVQCYRKGSQAASPSCLVLSCHTPNFMGIKNITEYNMYAYFCILAMILSILQWSCKIIRFILLVWKTSTMRWERKCPEKHCAIKPFIKSHLVR